MTSLHDRLTVIDGLIFYSDGDARDLLAGGYAAANVTVKDPMVGFEEGFDAMARWLALAARPDGPWHLVERAADIPAARAAGKVGLVMGWQETKLLGNRIERVAAFHRLGLRACQLTYNEASAVGDGCLEPRNGGLTRFGHEVVEAFNATGIAIDLSHVGERTCLDAARASRRPVLLTHANAKAVHERPRNKSDEVMRAVAATGGLCGASMHGFMNWDGDPAHPPALEGFVAHVRHMVNLVGIEHVSFGTDFAAVGDARAADFFLEMSATRYASGTGDYVRAFGNSLEGRFPPALNNPRHMARKTEALLAAGFSEDAVAKIMGGNLLRVLGEIWGG
ncbi:MAG: dipeptidase [Acetobacteraceae bacterium]|nr:dipeptidase [Acetobacteraceae bacterium]